jgi:hypothetical protein
MAVSPAQRLRIAQRAGYRCEYCRLHQDHAVKQHEPDHITPRKHGGGDEDDNLAWACFHCNRYKGSEVGAFDSETGQLVPLFNPRRQTWSDHFSLDGATIQPLSPVGRVTILVLQLNLPARLEVRELLQQVGLYP